MTERPDFGPDEILTPEQLVRVRSNFAKLSILSFQQAYRKPWNAASWIGGVECRVRFIFRCWCRPGSS
jgi:hypothetical protein